MNAKTVYFLSYCLVVFLTTLHAGNSHKSTYQISTVDIDNFWDAYDQLKVAASKKDSILVIQKEYIDKASASFKKFLKLRNFTAEEYIINISMYPKFWVSIRPLTQGIKARKNELDALYKTFNDSLKGFDAPDICFAIGCLRTGGTTYKNLLLIGSEIAAADSTVDKSELNPWHKSVIGNGGNIVSYVAHEVVHTQQHGVPLSEIFKLIKHKKLTLLNMSIIEGSADFITTIFFNLNINSRLQLYGNELECSLWKEFERSFTSTPFDYSAWLYNGNNSKKRPADLGYYIGYKIAESYYNHQSNKKKALKVLLNIGKYKSVYKKSEYQKKCIQ